METPCLHVKTSTAPARKPARKHRAATLHKAPCTTRKQGPKNVPKTLREKKPIRITIGTVFERVFGEFFGAGNWVVQGALCSVAARCFLEGLHAGVCEVFTCKQGVSTVLCSSAS